MTRFTDLIDGYRRFRATDWPAERERWSDLAEGQSPKVMVIACSDSRVEPAIISYRGDRWQALLDGMRRDKKARGDLLRFVVLDDVARPGILDVPDASLLFAAYQEISEGITA